MNSFLLPGQRLRGGLGVPGLSHGNMVESRRRNVVWKADAGFHRQGTGRTSTRLNSPWSILVRILPSLHSCRRCGRLSLFLRSSNGGVLLDTLHGMLKP